MLSWKLAKRILVVLHDVRVQPLLISSLEFWKKSFSKTHYPDVELRERLAEKTNLQKGRIQVN